MHEYEIYLKIDASHWKVEIFVFEFVLRFFLGLVGE